MNQLTDNFKKAFFLIIQSLLKIKMFLKLYIDVPLKIKNLENCIYVYYIKKKIETKVDNYKFITLIEILLISVICIFGKVNCSLSIFSLCEKLYRTFTEMNRYLNDTSLYHTLLKVSNTLSTAVGLRPYDIVYWKKVALACVCKIKIFTSF